MDNQENTGAPNRETTVIDTYISQFPYEIQAELNALRDAIRETAPQAQEKFSYQMPTFYLQGNLVHFAAHKGHIGFYPGASGIAAFQEQLAGYVHSKGAVQFPFGKPLPLDLVRDIVRYRAAENLQDAAMKKTGRKHPEN